MLFLDASEREDFVSHKVTWKIGPVPMRVLDTIRVRFMEAAAHSGLRRATKRPAPPPRAAVVAPAGDVAEVADGDPVEVPDAAAVAAVEAAAVAEAAAEAAERDRGVAIWTIEAAPIYRELVKWGVKGWNARNLVYEEVTEVVDGVPFKVLSPALVERLARIGDGILVVELGSAVKAANELSAEDALGFP